MFGFEALGQRGFARSGHAAYEDQPGTASGSRHETIIPQLTVK
jgi:hypothetical protein